MSRDSDADSDPCCLDGVICVGHQAKNAAQVNMIRINNKMEIIKSDHYDFKMEKIQYDDYDQQIQNDHNAILYD